MEAFDLENFLDAAQIELLNLAKLHGITVIVDGTRSYPTGKSTLCDYLRNQGITAYEAWELEENNVTLDNAAHTNSIHIIIQLNKPMRF